MACCGWRRAMRLAQQAQAAQALLGGQSAGVGQERVTHPGVGLPLPAPPPAAPAPAMSFGRIRSLRNPNAVRQLRVAPRAKQGRAMQTAFMYAVLNDSTQRAMSEIPAGAVVEAWGAPVDGVGYGPGHGSIFAAAAEGKFFGQRAFGAFPEQGRFTQARYRGADGSVHTGFMNVLDLARADAATGLVIDPNIPIASLPPSPVVNLPDSRTSCDPTLENCDPIPAEPRQPSPSAFGVSQTSSASIDPNAAAIDVLTRRTSTSIIPRAMVCGPAGCRLRTYSGALTGATLPPGTEVRVISRTKSLGRSYMAQTNYGWVHSSELVDAVDVAPHPPPQAPTSDVPVAAPSVGAEGRLLVAMSAGNVRGAPTTRSRIVKPYQAGDELVALNLNDFRVVIEDGRTWSWTPVTTLDGTRGWAATERLGVDTQKADLVVLGADGRWAPKQGAGAGLLLDPDMPAAPVLERSTAKSAFVTYPTRERNAPSPPLGAIVHFWSGVPLYTQPTTSAPVLGYTWGRPATVLAMNIASVDGDDVEWWQVRTEDGRTGYVIAKGTPFGTTVPANSSIEPGSPGIVFATCGPNGCTLHKTAGGPVQTLATGAPLVLPTGQAVVVLARTKGLRGSSHWVRVRDLDGRYDGWTLSTNLLDRGTTVQTSTGQAVLGGRSFCNLAAGCAVRTGLGETAPIAGAVPFGAEVEVTQRAGLFTKVDYPAGLNTLFSGWLPTSALREEAPVAPPASLSGACIFLRCPAYAYGPGGGYVRGTFAFNEQATIHAAPPAGRVVPPGYLYFTQPGGVEGFVEPRFMRPAAQGAAAGQIPSGGGGGVQPMGPRGPAGFTPTLPLLPGGPRVNVRKTLRGSRFATRVTTQNPDGTFTQRFV